MKIEESENQNSTFIYDGNSKLLTETNENGFYEFYTEKKGNECYFFIGRLSIYRRKIIIKNELELFVCFIDDNPNLKFYLK